MLDAHRAFIYGTTALGFRDDTSESMNEESGGEMREWQRKRLKILIRIKIIVRLIKIIVRLNEV